MDKNTITGFVLIVLIMLGSYFLLKPSDAEMKKERLVQDSIKRAKTAAAVVKTTKPDTSKKAVILADSALKKIPFGVATVGSEQFVTLENKELRVKLSNKGGRVYSVELKNYKTFDKKPLILFDGENNHFGLTFRAQDKNINTDELYFTASAQNLTVAEKDSSTLTMRLSYSPTQYIDYIYSLKGTGFKLGLTVKTTGLDNVIANSNTFNLDWQESLRKQEKDMKQERQYANIWYLDTNNDDSHFSSDEQKEISDKKLQWIAFKQHFFSVS